MAIQVRRGNEVDFDPEKMLPGEWAVSTDAKYVRMCFAPGVIARMATYEAFEADMEEIRAILKDVQTIEEAVERIQNEVNDTEIVVEQYAVMSKSYAVGGTGSRDGEDTDNSKYYYEQSKRIAQGINGIVPMGTITFEELPTEGIVNNAMYNISNSFTSDGRFNDGGGVYYGAGNNVLWTASGKWDVTASSGVTGIKGTSESTYRQGNVNISAANIGLGNVNNTSDMNKPISNAQKEKFDNIESDLGTADISAIGDGTVKGAISELDGTTVKWEDVFITDIETWIINATEPTSGYAVPETVGIPASGYYLCRVDVNALGAWKIITLTSISGVEGTGIIYFRVYANGNWSIEWRKLANADEYLPLTGGTLNGSLHAGVIDSTREFSETDHVTTGIFPYNSKLNDLRTSGITHYREGVAKALLAFNESGVILRDLEATKNNLLFGEHNKPSGSYTGNGSTTERNIDTGGIGNAIVIWSDNSYGAIVTPFGSIIFYNVEGDLSNYPRGDALFRNGILRLATVRDALNKSGVTYNYQVL